MKERLNLPVAEQNRFLYFQRKRYNAWDEMPAVLVCLHSFNRFLGGANSENLFLSTMRQTGDQKHNN